MEFEFAGAFCDWEILRAFVGCEEMVVGKGCVLLACSSVRGSNARCRGLRMMMFLDMI